MMILLLVFLVEFTEIRSEYYRFNFFEFVMPLIYVSPENNIG